MKSITVKSSERTLRLLEIMSKNKQGITFSEINQKLAIPKSSTSALIKELMNNGYIQFQDDTRKYVAGINFIKLAYTFIESSGIFEELDLLTKQISHELNFTSHAAILDGNQMIYLAKTAVADNLSLMRSVGLRLPAHCTAVGKMLLSDLSDDEIISLYADVEVLPQLTKKSITDLNVLIKHLQTTRDNQYAVEQQEASEYASCIALPIYHERKMLAACSVTIEHFNFDKLNITEVVATMRKYISFFERKYNASLF